MLCTQRQCTDYPEDYNYCIRDGVFSIHARDEGNGRLNNQMDTTGEEELNRAMYPIMNIAVGGNMGGEVDIQDWTDAFLEFAYVRWYQKGAESECNLE